jgi:type IV pilus assembly protein PilW
MTERSTKRHRLGPPGGQTRGNSAAHGRPGGPAPPRKCAASPPVTQRGVSLVELLVASAIGIFLTSGAMLVYVESRDAILVSESVARMQENASFALALVEPDVRAANYWGMHGAAEMIDGKATDPEPLAVTVNGDCATDFSIDLETPIGGANGTVPVDWTCIAADEHQALSDLLVVRRAADEATDAASLEAGRIYVRSDESPRGELFTGTEPPGYSPLAENHRLISHVYYVRPWSYVDADGNRDGLPSLRRKVLGRFAGQPTITDEEVIPGVEDMQLQLGVDTDGDEAPNLYVDPDNDTVLDGLGATVVSVRLWLLMRTEREELGYEDKATYTFADVTRKTGTAEFPDPFRRLLVRRTIALRNH